MGTQTDSGVGWAALTVWAVVNAVNLLQAVGFLSRVSSGSTAINHTLGYAIMALAVPSIVAAVALMRAGAGWTQVVGPLVFLAFIALMVVVDYASPVEFRSPPRPAILVPFLALFFGAILLMGLPMFRMNRSLWRVTALTTFLLLSAMGYAMRRGAG